MIVFIDRQHSGKPHRLRDLGAAVDANDDGDISTDEAEAIWTARYGIELEIALRDFGIDVMPISDGSYSSRHSRVNRYCDKYPTKGPFIYLALHCNAGGPRAKYGAFFFDHRSTYGEGLAKHLAEALQSTVGPIKEGKAIEANPDDWTKNAYSCISGVGEAIGICCEPFFLDSASHKRLLSQGGMMSIGRGIALGIKEWSKKFT